MSCLVLFCLLCLAGVAAGLSGAEGAAHPDKAHVRRDRAAARAFQRTCRPRQARDSGLLQTRPSPDGPGKENRDRGGGPRTPQAFVRLFVFVVVLVVLCVVVFCLALLRLLFGEHVFFYRKHSIMQHVCLCCFVSLLCVCVFFFCVLVFLLFRLCVRLVVHLVSVLFVLAVGGVSCAGAVFLVCLLGLLVAFLRFVFRFFLGFFFARSLNRYSSLKNYRMCM